MSTKSITVSRPKKRVNPPKEADLCDFPLCTQLLFFPKWHLRIFRIPLFKSRSVATSPGLADVAVVEDAAISVEKSMTLDSLKRPDDLRRFSWSFSSRWSSLKSLKSPLSSTWSKWPSLRWTAWRTSVFWSPSKVTFLWSLPVTLVWNSAGCFSELWNDPFLFLDFLLCPFSPSSPCFLFCLSPCFWLSLPSKTPTTYCPKKEASSIAIPLYIYKLRIRDEIERVLYVLLSILPLAYLQMRR